MYNYFAYEKQQKEMDDKLRMTSRYTKDSHKHSSKQVNKYNNNYRKPGSLS